MAKADEFKDDNNESKPKKNNLLQLLKENLNYKGEAKESNWYTSWRTKNNEPKPIDNTGQNHEVQRSRKRKKRSLANVTYAFIIDMLEQKNGGVAERLTFDNFGA